MRRRRNHTVLLALCATVVLAACAEFEKAEPSSFGWVWAKEGKPANFAHANFSCRRTVTKVSRMEAHASMEKPGKSTRLPSYAKQSFRQCMKGRGWVMRNR